MVRGPARGHNRDDGIIGRGQFVLHGGEVLRDFRIFGFRLCLIDDIHPDCEHVCGRQRRRRRDHVPVRRRRVPDRVRTGSFRRCPEGRRFIGRDVHEDQAGRRLERRRCGRGHVVRQHRAGPQRQDADRAERHPHQSFIGDRRHYLHSQERQHHEHGRERENTRTAHEACRCRRRRVQQRVRRDRDLLHMGREQQADGLGFDGRRRSGRVR